MPPLCGPRLFRQNESHPGTCAEACPPHTDAVAGAATVSADLRSLPADWRDRRPGGYGTGPLESALVTDKDIRCRYLITASRTKNAERHGEAEGRGGLDVQDERELGRWPSPAALRLDCTAHGS